MILTGIFDCNQIIYSFLDSSSFLKLKSVSKSMKQEIEKTERYKKIAKIANFSWNVAIKSSVYHTSPSHLHSNGKNLRVMNYYADQLWNIDPNTDSNLKPIILESDKVWKEVFWNNTEVAIAKPVYPERRASNNHYPTGYTTTIFNTENGENLGGMRDVWMFPVDWYGDSLLMKTKKENNIQNENLFIWNILNGCEVNSPQQIFSLDDKNFSKIICRNEKIFGIWHKKEQPFSQFDLQKQTLIPLGYQIHWLENSLGSIGNFGVTNRGNLYFSKGKSFLLLDGKTAKQISSIALSILPTGIIYQFPLMACYHQYEFFVYDVRRADKYVYHHNYLTLQKLIRKTMSIQTFIMSALRVDPYYDLKIRGFAFHNQSLFVSKMDDSIDHFDLAATPNFSLKKFLSW